MQNHIIAYFVPLGEMILRTKKFSRMRKYVKNYVWMILKGMEYDLFLLKSLNKLRIYCFI